MDCWFPMLHCFCTDADRLAGLDAVVYFSCVGWNHDEPSFSKAFDHQGECYLWNAWMKHFPLSARVSKVRMEVTCTKWKARIVPHYRPGKRKLWIFKDVIIRRMYLFSLFCFNYCFVVGNFIWFIESYCWLSCMSHWACALFLYILTMFIIFCNKE